MEMFHWIMLLQINVWLIVCSTLHFTEASNNTSPEHNLIEDLLARYPYGNKFARPVTDYRRNVTVKVGIHLTQLLNLDEKSQVLKTRAWISMTWRDELLNWDHEDYGWLWAVVLPQEKIWLPDVQLYNAIEPPKNMQGDTVRVSKFGVIQWTPAYVIQTGCEVNVTNFPFDEQTCTFSFYSWIYSGLELDLVADDNNELITPSSLDTNSPSYTEAGWEMRSGPVRREVTQFACCVDTYPKIHFDLYLKRQPHFFTFILVLPSILLSALTFVIFLLPPSSGERISMGLSIFVSYFMLFLILVESTPHSGTSLPKLGVYICASMVMVAVAIAMTSSVAKLMDLADRGIPVPGWVQRVFLYWLGPVLCVRKTRMCSRRRPHDNEADDVTNWDGNNSEMFTEALGVPLKQLEPSPEFHTDHQNATLLLSQQMHVLITKVSVIAKYLDRKEESAEKCDQWRLVAIAIQRLFLVLYVTIYVYIVVTILPRPQSVLLFKVTANA